jgi:hypothetical protein
MYGFRNFFNDRGEDGKVIDLYLINPELKISEIAQQTGKSQAEIYRILHSHDINPNRLKINHEKVIRLHHAGWGIKEIAEFTGYTTRNIRYIVAKKGLHG